MVIFIFQFRSQNLAIRDAAYQKALDDYTDSISLLVQRPDLAKLVDELGPIRQGQTPTPMTPERRTVFTYMVLQYSLFERVYLLYSKKWVDEETWSQWYAWMKIMAKHPSFVEVHRRSEGTFDKEFQKLVEEATKA